jgi:hypothetical protein
VPSRATACLVLVTTALATAAPVAASPTTRTALARLGPHARGLGDDLARLARSGLPADLVETKIREGLAKGVPSERVAIVAQGMVRRIELVGLVARKYARGQKLGPLVRAGVAAHTAGVPLHLIDRLMAAADPLGTASTVLALTTVADLAGRDYPTRASVELVEALLARPAHRDELARALGTVEAAGQRLAGDKDRAVAAVLADVRQGRSLRPAMATNADDDQD